MNAFILGRSSESGKWSFCLLDCMLIASGNLDFSHSVAICICYVINPFIGEKWLYLVTFPIALCREDRDRILINSLLFPSSPSFNSVPSVVTRFPFCRKVDSSLSCLLTSYDKLLEQSIVLHCHVHFIAAVLVVVAVAAVHCEHHRCLQYWFHIVVSHSKSDSSFHLFA